MVLLLDVFALLTAARCATQLPAPALIVRTRTSIVVHAFIARPHAQSREHDSKLKHERQCKRSQKYERQRAKRQKKRARSPHAACKQTAACTRPNVAKIEQKANSRKRTEPCKRAKNHAATAKNMWPPGIEPTPSSLGR
jgi:hypothetical protein